MVNTGYRCWAAVLLLQLSETCVGSALPAIDRPDFLKTVDYVESLVRNVSSHYTVDEVFNPAIHGTRMPEKRSLEIDYRNQGELYYYDVTIQGGRLIKNKPGRAVDAFNGEKRMQWNPNEVKGDIFKDPFQHAWPLPRDFGASLGQGKGIAATLADCTIGTLEPRPWNDKECYFVEAVQKNGAKLRAWIDPAAGWRGRHVELEGADGKLQYESTVEQFKDCGNGVWMPEKGTAKLYATDKDGKLVVSCARTLNVSNVKVNDEKLGRESFEVQFPNGTALFDHILGVGFVTGLTSPEGVPQASLDKIADQVKAGAVPKGSIPDSAPAAAAKGVSDVKGSSVAQPHAAGEAGPMAPATGTRVSRAALWVVCGMIVLGIMVWVALRRQHARGLHHDEK